MDRVRWNCREMFLLFEDIHSSTGTTFFYSFHFTELHIKLGMNYASSLNIEQTHPRLKCLVIAPPS